MGKREEKLRVTGLTGHWSRGECTIKNKMRKDEEKWIYCAIKLGKRMNDASRQDTHVLIPTTCKCVFIHCEHKSRYHKMGETILGYVDNPK